MKSHLLYWIKWWNPKKTRGHISITKVQEATSPQKDRFVAWTSTPTKAFQLKGNDLELSRMERNWKSFVEYIFHNGNLHHRRILSWSGLHTYIHQHYGAYLGPLLFSAIRFIFLTSHGLLSFLSICSTSLYSLLDSISKKLIVKTIKLLGWQIKEWDKLMGQLISNLSIHPNSNNKNASKYAPQAGPQCRM